MEDRVKLNNGKSSIIKVPSDYSPASFEAFLADLKDGMFVDVAPNNSLDEDAGVSVIGTPLNKANMLSDTTASEIGFESAENPSVDDAFKKINDKLDVINTATLASSGWTETSSGSTIWTQTVPIADITADSNIEWDINVDTSYTADAVLEIQTAMSFIGRVVTANGSVTFTAYNFVPTVNIPIMIRGI